MSAVDYDIKVDYGALPAELVREFLHAHIVNVAAAQAINFAGPYVQRKLSENTPVGATGKARQSVIFEPARPAGFREVVGFVTYAAPASLYIGFANDGTRAHFPPITPLSYWAARKLGDARLGWAIARHIARFGTPPQKFVERTKRETEFMAAEMMQAAFTSYFNQWGSGIGTP